MDVQEIVKRLFEIADLILFLIKGLTNLCKPGPGHLTVKAKYKLQLSSQELIQEFLGKTCRPRFWRQSELTVERIADNLWNNLRFAQWKQAGNYSCAGVWVNKCPRWWVAGGSAVMFIMPQILLFGTNWALGKGNWIFITIAYQGSSPFSKVMQEVK